MALIRTIYILIGVVGMVASAGFAGSAGFSASAGAQEYDFGTGLVAGGGNALAEIDISINGQELTAVIRNTSPDESNYGGNPSLLSPSIIGFGFDLVGDFGESLVLEDWSLIAHKDSGRLKELNGARPKWTDSNTDNSFAFSAIKDKNGLYNPEATGGLKNILEYAKFTEAVLTAKFDHSVNLVENLQETFSPFVRFGYVGSALLPQTINTYGTLRTGGGPGHNSPEPGSLLIWALGTATWVGVMRRGRPGHRA